MHNLPRTSYEARAAGVAVVSGELPPMLLDVPLLVLPGPLPSRLGAEGSVLVDAYAQIFGLQARHPPAPEHALVDAGLRRYGQRRDVVRALDLAQESLLASVVVVLFQDLPRQPQVAVHPRGGKGRHGG